MLNIKRALDHLDERLNHFEQRRTIDYETFLTLLVLHPDVVIRNVFQVFHDMFETHVGRGTDEYPDDPESIQFLHSMFKCNTRP